MEQIQVRYDVALAVTRHGSCRAQAPLIADVTAEPSFPS